MDQTNNGEMLDDSLNKGFTMVYDSRKYDHRLVQFNANDCINKSLAFIENEMKK